MRYLEMFREACMCMFSTGNYVMYDSLRINYIVFLFDYPFTKMWG